MHTLYDFRFSGNGWKVRRFLGTTGLAFRWVEVDILARETRQPWFLAKNPAGEIPVLELPDGTCLAESHAILTYLAEGTAWLPADRVLRAQILRWMCFEQTHIDGVISRARFRRRYPHAIPTTEADFVRWHAQGSRALGLLDRHLEGRTWLVGDALAHPSIADLAVYAYVHVAEEGGFSLTDRPHLCAWLDRVAALPGHLPLGVPPSPSPLP